MSLSSPIDPQQQSPPPVTEQAYTVHSGHTSIGPVIAVLAVIIILGIIAGMIGRLCSGRSIMGHGPFDFEGWIERKCSSCIDGRIESPPRPPTPTPPRTAESADESGGVHVEEKKTEETGQSHQQHSENEE